MKKYMWIILIALVVISILGVTNVFAKSEPPVNPYCFITQTPTPTKTPTSTFTATYTNTFTATSTHTKTPTSTPTPTTPIETNTPTDTVTPTRTGTPVPTGTPTQTLTPTATPTGTLLPTKTPKKTPKKTPNVCVDTYTGKDVVVLIQHNADLMHFGIQIGNDYDGLCRFEVPEGQFPNPADVSYFCNCGMPKADWNTNTYERLKIYTDCNGKQTLRGTWFPGIEAVKWQFGDYCPTSSCE